MSPAGVAVSGPATNMLPLPLNGSIVARTVPVARSIWVTAPPAAGIQSESPDTTAWKTGSQPPGEETVEPPVAGSVPRFGGGFHVDGTVQLCTSWLPCHAKCRSFHK